MSNFIRSVIFLFFRNYRNPGYLLNTTYIFGRYHHSLAAVTLVKYGYCKIENIPDGEINERSFSYPHPGFLSHYQ